MQQVTLGGPGMRNFPKGQQGGYLKLLLGQGGMLSRPQMRTYTIRAQRDDAIDVQFALHGENAAGPATSWALDAKPGDTIKAGGPGPAKPLPDSFDFYLIAGDKTALPAIAANLEALASDARGVAVLEVQSPEDQIDLSAPEGVEIRWLVNPQPGEQPTLLADALRAVDLPEGTLAAWAACEFSSMRELRFYLKDELGLGAGALYISSYWKHGLDEPAHKQLKRQDASDISA